MLQRFAEFMTIGGKGPPKIDILKTDLNKQKVFQATIRGYLVNTDQFGYPIGFCL